MNKEVKVGLFTIISGAILYFGFSFLKGNNFFSTNQTYYAIYQNIDGLNISNPVIVNGFSVGRVSNIEILQKKNNQIIVELDVRGSLIIGDNTTATLINSDFLGSKAILLEIGDITKPMNSGDTIKGEVDKGIAALLENAKPLTHDIGVTISRLNEVLLGMEGAGEEIKSTLNTLEATVKTANGFISNTDSQLKVTFSELNSLVKNINERVSQLQPVLSSADSVLTTVNGLPLNSAVSTLNNTLSELEIAVNSINNQNGSIGKLLHNDSLYVNLNTTIEDLDQLILHFDQNPKHFLAPLGKSKSKIEKDRTNNSN